MKEYFGYCLLCTYQNYIKIQVELKKKEKGTSEPIDPVGM